MKINYIEYYNKNVDWRLTRTHFGDLTLLVGASGVGKTRILDAINTVKKIADGKGFFGVKWEIECTLSNGSNITWSGEFETRKKTIRGSQESEPHLVSFKYFIDQLRELRVS